MARVIITKELEKEINKKFKNESKKIFSLMLALEDNLKKGKELGIIGKVIIKELKYKKCRFYFITDYAKLKFLSVSNLTDLLIKFVRISEKKDQQKVISVIKEVLKEINK